MYRNETRNVQAQSTREREIGGHEAQRHRHDEQRADDTRRRRNRDIEPAARTTDDKPKSEAEYLVHVDLIRGATGVPVGPPQSARLRASRCAANRSVSAYPTLIATTSIAPINTGGAGNGTAVSRQTTPIANASASPIATFNASLRSFFRLQMRFDEPQLFVHFARYLGKDVRRIGVTKLRCRVDPGAR